MVRNAVREELRNRYLKGDRENIEAGKYIFAGRATGTGNAAEVVPIQVNEVENSVLVELVGIVELAGDDATATSECVDESIDKRLIVESLFAARRIAGVVNLESAEAINQPVSLRPVIIGQYAKIAAKDSGHLATVVVIVIVFVSVGVWGYDARNHHRLGAAGELPAQLIAATYAVGGTRWRCRSPNGVQTTEQGFATAWPGL